MQNYNPIHLLSNYPEVTNVNSMVYIHLCNCLHIYTKYFLNIFFGLLVALFYKNGILFQVHNCISKNLGTRYISGLRILFRCQKGGMLQVTQQDLCSVP